MNPSVSVIITTKNSAKTLENCLASLKNQSYENIELIVVDNNSTDKTKEIARKFTDKVFNFGPERSAQRNFGVKHSNGDYVVIIDSDMEFSKGIVKSAVGKITSDANIKAIIIPEESFGEGFWAKCKKLERSFYIGVGWMEAARFFPRIVFDEMGGYDEQNTGTEDYDLPQRVRERYGRNSTGRINDLIYHNERRINLWKTCKKKFYYAQRLDKYKSIDANRSNFNKQSSILTRYCLFFSHPRLLFKNPILGIGMLFMKTCEFGAGGIGYISRKKDRLK